jgi:FkbM family methyltransferase
VDRRRRAAFARELFYRLARRFTPVIAVESGDQRYFMSTDDHGVGMTLFMGDDVERRTFGRALEALATAGVDGAARGTLLDVGAHVGTTTVTALGAFGFQRAICFEPSPRNRELLQLNLSYNGLEDRAAVVPVALSDRSGEAQFEVAPMNPSDGRVRVADASADAGAFGEEGWETIAVETATLDSLVRSGAVEAGDVGLIWIDAQGHEGHVLAGAGSVLDREVPVVIEFWPYGLRRADGLEILTDIVAERFRLVVDLDGAGGSAPARPAAEIRELVDAYWGVAQTDLLLIP